MTQIQAIIHLDNSFVHQVLRNLNKTNQYYLH